MMERFLAALVFVVICFIVVVTAWMIAFGTDWRENCRDAGGVPVPGGGGHYCLVRR